MSINQLVSSFKQLPFEDKEKIFTFLSEHVEKGKGIDAKIARIEKQLTRVLADSWNKTADKAIAAALSAVPNNEQPFTKKTSQRVISKLENAFSGVEKKTEKRVQSDIQEAYKLYKEDFRKRFKLKTTEKGDVLTFTSKRFDEKLGMMVPYTRVVKSGSIRKFKKIKKELGISDSFIWDNIARLANVAIGDHFPNSLKPLLINTLKVAVLEKGMNNSQANIFLQKELSRVLGGSPNKAIPESFQGGPARVDNYFKGLNDTNMTFAKNFSQISLMNEAGITQIQYVAIVDNLTSEICLQMDGRVFTIEQGMAHMSKILDCEDVASLKEASPFTRDLKSFGLGRGISLTNPEISSRLASAGVICPPLHFRCRSSLEPF